MKPLIRLLTAVCTLLCAVHSVDAKDRLLERSGRTPDWLLSAGEEHFAVFARSADPDEARDRCLEEIRQYIVNSIAANIVSVETSTSQSHNADGTENIYSTYSSELRTTAAKLPFLTDLSLSKAEEIYWEKYLRKSDKSCYYVYHVLYPFSRAERRRLVREFVDYDRAMYDRLELLRERYDTLTDVAGIDEGVRELKSLVSYFFDEVRRTEAESLLEEYRKAYSKIALVPENKELGTFRYSLRFNGRKLACSKQPQLRSDTAQSLDLKPEGDDYVLTYDWSLCYPTDDNFVLIRYTFPGARLDYRLAFDVRENERQLSPVGIMEIGAIARDSVWQAEVRLDLRARNDGSFTVRNTSFTLPHMLDFVQSEPLVFEGRGMHSLRFRQQLEFAPAEAGHGMVTGTMEVLRDNRTEQVSFTLPYKLEIIEETQTEQP